MLNVSREGGTAVVVTPPDPAAVVTLADCKAALGIMATDKDAMITAAIAAVVSQLEPALGGWLGRAIGVQTWELQLPSFAHLRIYGRGAPANAIALPYPPLIAVAGVTYADVTGADQTLTLGTGYRVLRMGSLGKQYIAPPYGQTWPQGRSDVAAVRIRYSCGYNQDNKLPPAIVQAIVLGVRALLNVTERNLFISEDSVEGVGIKRFIVGGGAAVIIKDAIGDLLANLSVTEL